MQSSSEQPLVGEERYVTTLITAAKETKIEDDSFFLWYKNQQEIYTLYCSVKSGLTFFFYQTTDRLVSKELSWGSETIKFCIKQADKSQISTMWR